MSLDRFLEEKQEAIKEAIEAYRALLDALGALPSDWAREIVANLQNDLAHNHPDASRVKNQEDRSLQVNSSHSGLQSPTHAIVALLKANPAGLTAQEIVSTLADNIRTTAKKPKSILYSTLAVMKRSQKVSQSADGRYRLTQPPTIRKQST